MKTTLQLILIPFLLGMHLLAEDTPDNMPYPEDANLTLNDIWALESLFGEPFDRATARRHPVIEFHLKDMRVLGNTGCNSFRGSMKTGEERLTIDLGAMTRMYCPGDVEPNFIKAMHATKTFKIEKLRLHLMDEEDEVVAVFKKVD
jgi:heat shock protein HslJ